MYLFSDDQQRRRVAEFRLVLLDQDGAEIPDTALNEKPCVFTPGMKEVLQMRDVELFVRLTTRVSLLDSSRFLSSIPTFIFQTAQDPLPTAQAGGGTNFYLSPLKSHFDRTFRKMGRTLYQ